MYMLICKESIVLFVFVPLFCFGHLRSGGTVSVITVFHASAARWKLSNQSALCLSNACVIVQKVCLGGSLYDDGCKRMKAVKSFSSKLETILTLSLALRNTSLYLCSLQPFPNLEELERIATGEHFLPACNVYITHPHSYPPF